MSKQKVEIAKKNRKGARSLVARVRNSWQLYIMALPAMLLLFLFAYLPMGGLVIAFKDYQFKKGIWGSDWIHPWYRNFEILFRNNASAMSAIRNTVCLNLMFIICGTIFALALSLAINEITQKHVKKLCQSLTFLPYFISTVVVGIFVTGMLGYESGAINRFLISLGLERVAFYTEPSYWPVILLIVNIWKGAGYSAVVYLAGISGIDETYFEAAKIDGATRGQQIWYITLPLLKPTIIIMTLLAVGRIMNADFGLFYNVTGDMPLLYPTTDVLDTYIYRALRKMGDIGISSATGFFQSVVGFVMVMGSNLIARKYEKDAALF